MALVVSQVILIGVAAAVDFVVFVAVAAVFVVALVELVAVSVVDVVVKVVCVASGDSTWVWFPSIVECMGRAWA